MSTTPPVAEPGEPSNRWPWIALAAGLLIVAIAVIIFFYNRQRTVNITVEGTPTAAAVARAVSPVPATLVPPTLPPSATLAPSATPAATPTAAPPPTVPPTPPPTFPPTPLPAPTPPPPPVVVAAPPPPAPPAPAAGQPAPAGQPTPVSGQPTPVAAAQPTPVAGQPTPVSAQPAPAAAGQATAAAQATPAPSGTPAPSPSPTPFAGQVANPGGLGNTRPDLDAAFGPPVGETPSRLVVYRKNNFEYHVGFVPDPTSGRAALLVEMPQPQTNASPLTIESATAEAHKLLPKDAQPPNAPAEGNNQFVVERYTSQLLAEVLPASAFAANNGQPGQFLVVYVRDPAQQSRIARFIIGPGSDPQALINQGT